MKEYATVQWISEEKGVLSNILTPLFQRRAHSSAPLVGVLFKRLRLLFGVALFEVFSPNNTRLNRILKLIRLKVSFVVSCPWCVEMNSTQLRKVGITDNELQYLQAGKTKPSTLSPKELCAIEFASAISASRVTVSKSLAFKLKSHFSEKELVTLSFAAAQVNFFARLFQSWMRTKE